MTARYVRFNPVHWNARGGLPKHDICMRVGVFTCTGGEFLRKLVHLSCSHSISLSCLHSSHSHHFCNGGGKNIDRSCTS